MSVIEVFEVIILYPFYTAFEIRINDETFLSKSLFWNGDFRENIIIKDKNIICGKKRTEKDKKT